jgi:hypothetical protein
MVSDKDEKEWSMPLGNMPDVYAGRRELLVLADSQRYVGQYLSHILSSKRQWNHPRHSRCEDARSFPRLR